jgi:hypothetical protein
MELQQGKSQLAVRFCENLVNSEVVGFLWIAAGIIRTIW